MSKLPSERIPSRTGLDRDGSTLVASADLLATTADPSGEGDSIWDRSSAFRTTERKTRSMLGDSLIQPEKPLPMVGSYQLLSPLGMGGMSSVFRAVHVDSGVEVAVKILPRTLAKNPTLLQRFLREAKSAEALEHPNIVAIYDRGFDSGRHYLVLEYVAGGDLHDQVKANGPMELAHALAVIRPVAEGLRFAATRGLIHRDIKPANILETADGRVKIADLGLALQAEEEDERVTREGTTVGTVDYMSPEQARDSRGTSIRSDLYSLGCTLYFLLTGQPPYPGGDVAYKLNRHINSPPPDPRDLRPELPLSLSRLILRMMAKQPEKRFEDYDELLTALDVVTNPNGSRMGESPLYDVPDDGFDALHTIAGEGSSSGSELGLFALSDLAPLDEPLDRSKPRSSAAVAERASAPTALDLFDDEPVFELLPGIAEPREARSMSQSEKSWLLTCILVGVGLILLVIGGDQLIRATQSEMARHAGERPILPDRPAAPRLPDRDVEPEPRPIVSALEHSLPRNEQKKSVVVESDRPKVAIPPRWVEPTDPVNEPIAETIPGSDGESSYLPDWAADKIPSSFPGKLVGVRRVSESGGDPEMKPTLRSALDVPGLGNVEIADDGPFFESRFRVAAESRIIRARPGFRPIIAVERSRTTETSNPEAFLDLADKTLVLDGIDLVVDPSELPRSVTSLILCRGASLAFHNCTITVIGGRPGTPFSLVRAGASEKPSRIRFEQTLLRGSLSSVVDLSKGPADLVLNRSVVLNSQGPIVSADFSATQDRRVFLVCDVLGSTGSIVQLSEGLSGTASNALTVRAMGSTFAHFQSSARTSFIASRGNQGGPAELLDWRGESNHFSGWGGWLSKNGEKEVPVPRIEDAGAIWPGTDQRSTTSLAQWPLSPALDSIAPMQLLDLAREREATLQRVPVPSSFLREKSMTRFARPELPRPPAGPNPSQMLGSRGQLSQALTPTATRSPSDPAPLKNVSNARAIARELIFDTEAVGTDGDLGAFLRRSILSADRLVRVRIRGSLSHPCTPVRLPDGVSLDLIVEANASGLTPSWTLTKGIRADSLLELHGGNLAATGLRLSREGTPLLKHLVRVESGHLLLTRCSLTSPGPAEPGGGGLVAHLAPGSRPLNQSVMIGGPFEPLPDRPVCRIADSVLITGGDVLLAEMGRGLVVFSNCAIAAGRTAFVLNPTLVARDRFDADLVLEGCTVASEANIVSLGSWPGTNPGPDRPWLVSTDSCAFFGTYDRPTRERERETVMLRADPESFALGVLSWQSHADVFEVPRFTAAGESTNRQTFRADLRRNWVELWGEAHFRNSTGPRTQGSPPSAKLVDRLTPGKISAGDLALDPDYLPPGHRPGDLGVDFARLGVTPATRPAKKR